MYLIKDCTVFLIYQFQKNHEFWTFFSTKLQNSIKSFFVGQELYYDFLFSDREVLQQKTTVTKTRSRTQVLAIPDYDAIETVPEEKNDNVKVDTPIVEHDITEHEQVTIEDGQDLMEIDDESVRQICPAPIRSLRRTEIPDKKIVCSVKTMEIDDETRNKENYAEQSLKSAVTLATNFGPKRKILHEVNTFEPPMKRSQNQTQNYTMQIPHQATLQGQRQCIMASVLETLKQEQELAKMHQEQELARNHMSARYQE